MILLSQVMKIKKISNIVESVNRSCIFAKERSYNQLNFKAGTFKINGATIEIGVRDSLRNIIDKFNSKKSTTRIEVKIDRKNKLLLQSQNKKVDIVDYDGVLFDIHNKGMLGNSNNCLLQIVRTIGNKINYYVVINYYRLR